MKMQSGLEVRSEKLIKKPVNEVFKALSQGLLFLNCGVEAATMEIDFRVGGKYFIDFKHYGIANTGEFLEIVPDRKIAFSWCTSFEPPLKPDTTVTIELTAEGGQTRLRLHHTGFKNEEDRASHQGGWDSGINDFTGELQDGKLRLMRVYQAPVPQLFDLCQRQLVKGQVVETVANKKIVFNLDATRVTLTFDDEDDGGSSVELIHDRLNTEALRATHRLAWQKLTGAMKVELSKA